MRKSLCLILAVTVMLSCAVNVFAVTPILDANGEKVLTKVTMPNKAASGVDDTHTAWEFKSPTGFYYTVIPERYEEGENGEKLYFVVSNTYYGKVPGMSTALEKTASKEERAKFIFDPEISGSYAEWLNNGFLDGSAAAEGHNACTGAALDEGIRDYIAEHDWYVEGYGPNTSGSENIDEKYYYDYTVRCKVSLLSTPELATYGKYMKQSLKFANGNAVPADLAYSCLLRTFSQLGSTSNNGVFIRRYVQASGNTGNINTSYCGIRPCFYVSERYFKENRIFEYGDYVKTVIKENNTRSSLGELGYSENEINTICTDTTLTFDSVIISGDGLVGRELSVSYVFSDGVEDRCNTGETVIKWYMSDSESGEYTKIDGANGSTYAAVASDSGSYIKASATPVSADGSYGIEKMSDNAIFIRGNINKVIPETTTATNTFGTNKGEVSPKRPENEFLYKSDDGEFRYFLLDATEKNGEAAFLLYSKDNYGDVSTVGEIVHTNNVFNPDEEGNIAHWLNNEFLNGEASAQNGSNAVFDRMAAEYAVENDWYTEGNGKDASILYKNTSITKTDYTATCKIALLSFSEYLKYADKIGYESTKIIGSAGDRVLMRSPNSNTFLAMKFFGAGSGNVSHQNIANELNSDGSVKASNSFYNQTTPVVIRPILYVGIDYFKNAKLSSAGDNVKKTIRENIPKDELLGLYTEAELSDILGYSSQGSDISDASVYGVCAAGEMLTVYYDADKISESAEVSVSWYVSDYEDTSYTKTADGISYTIPSSYSGKYITANFDVTDNASGEKLKSSKIYVGKVGNERKISAVCSYNQGSASFVIKNKSGDNTKKVRIIAAAFDENNIMLDGITSEIVTLDGNVNNFDNISVPDRADAAYLRIMAFDFDDNSPLCGITVR